jgi:ABC-type methionine transport system permease subunit
MMNSTPNSLPLSMISHRVHRWEIFTILMLILMDLSWITPAYSLLIGWSLGTSAAIAFLVFGVIYLTSSIVASGSFR